MKAGILMRVLFCKIQCPFFCFCKPSAAHHLYRQSPLRLEDSPHVVVPSTAEDFAVPNVPEKSPSDESVKVNGKQEAGSTLLKSCLRKFPQEPHSTKEAVKKSVQWVDASGQELAEIKEFESGETGDTDTEDDSNHCLCLIL